MDDQALDRILSERLAALRDIDDANSQVSSIMNALDTPPIPARESAPSHDWLLLAAWLLAAFVALPLLTQANPAVLLGDTVGAMAAPAYASIMSLGAALIAGLLVYPLLTE